MPPYRQFGGPKLPKALLDQVDGPAKHSQRRGRNVQHARNINDAGQKQNKGEKWSQEQSASSLSSKRSKTSSHVKSDTEDDFDGFEDEEEEDSGEDPTPPKKTLLKESDTGKKAGQAADMASRRAPMKEDREIAELEKKLGIAGKKTKSKSTGEDGLDNLLEGLGGSDSEDSSDQGTKRKNEEYEEWLQAKRRKVVDQRTKLKHESDEEMLDLGSEDGSSSGDESRGSEDNELEQREQLADTDTKQPVKRKQGRENPYVAPGSGLQQSNAKYVPPILRGVAKDDENMMQQLRRRTQGLVNRLSEANMLSIVGDIESVYRSHPRQYVSSTLIQVLVDTVCDRASLLDSFLTLHAGFIAAIYKIIGPDFGAQMVERLCLKFDQAFEKIQVEKAGKEANNVLSLLSQLYVFQIINSVIIFDFLRVLLDDISEVNTELLLRVIRSCGQQLRQDDPSALKDIVTILQRTIARTGEANLSVRTKFMIETIHDLKNNRSRGTASISAERITAMKKTLGHLNSRQTLAATEPLAINLSDLRNAEKKGKWWLVGASWKGQADQTNGLEKQRKHNDPAMEDNQSDLNAHLLDLAKRHGMNTDIRRAVFVTIMSASDYKDCHVKLLKLRLSRNQEQEVPRVLLRCACAESRYNPYYTLVASRLCSERKIRFGFQRVFWDYFKKMSSDEDEGAMEDEEDQSQSLKLPAIVNLAKFFGHLIAEESLNLSILKNADLMDLQAKEKVFLEVLLITLLSKMSNGKTTKLASVFDSTVITPEWAKALQVFLKRQVLKSDLIKAQSEGDSMQGLCRQAITRLKEIATGPEMG